MARFIKKHKHEIGLSPYDLTFRGDKKIENVLLRIIDFDSLNLNEEIIKNVSDINKFKNSDTVTWLNIDGLHNINIIKELAKVFNLDSLILADVMNTETRPKIQEYENCIYISVKMLQLNEKSGIISIENLSLILTKSALITFQEKKGDVFEPVRERIRTSKKRIRNSNIDYLTFALLDVVIDNYIHILSVLGEKIEDIEDNFIMNPSKNVVEKINFYKRELNFIRKNIGPTKEMLLALSKIESELINDSSSIFFKELQDNLKQVLESSESYREILSDQLNIYHSSMSTKLNDTMMFLTVFSVIFIPLTFIAGVYGTNFDVLPELHYKYSYFIMLGLMAIIAIGMLLYFKRKKWL
ncbi:MAG: magnesium/cobalt transporter CorA [Flavobacteriales bacterium]|jgi:magnesium transporter|nr:magnesium/cobalt transporter CorA [Flavobacteriales bacterium]